MLETSILQILRMFPRGTTDGQLLFRLDSRGYGNDPSALLAALAALTERGDIERHGDRWKPTARPVADNTENRLTAGDHGTVLADGNNLISMHGTVEAKDVNPDSLDASDDASALHSWRSVLSYYASTQRQDPRGSVERFPDQHGIGWQLFDAHGRWWHGGRLVFPSSALPGKFREALALAGHSGTAALGWPVTVLQQSTGTSCAPALLFPATWALDQTNLMLTVDAVPPMINPAWLSVIRRRKGGREEQLTEAILGSEGGSTFEEIAPRLGHVLASMGGALLRPGDLARETSLVGEGLRNAAAIFLPDEAAFTRKVAEDLDRIAAWGADRRSRTALAALLDAETRTDLDAMPLAPPSPLSDLQAAAAEAAFAGPVTAIQGPPGTGKSQTVVALISSAVAAGQTVLFVARNHRALDEVEERVAALFPDIPILLRGRDADGERDTSFLDALADIVNGRAIDRDAHLAARASREELLVSMTARSHDRRTNAARERICLAMSELADRAQAIRDTLPSGVSPRRPTWLIRIWLLARTRFARGDSSRHPLPENATVHEIEARIGELNRELVALTTVGGGSSEASVQTLRRIASATVLPDEGTIRHLRGRQSDLGFQRGGAKVSSLTTEDAALILKHRPVWAISSLSVPSRVPLVPGLFDLAIFDEASQADIASSLPVLARARRAVIVGDPQQLTFIPGLGREQEHALMDAAGMPRTGRAGWAQSINSLFDFAASRLGAERITLLADQFRSAPDIVEYTSQAFYNGRLVARRDNDEFRPPRGYRPGLHWEDVRGAAGREDGGNVNAIEADWIVARLAALAREDGFEGKVGVISPFNAQVALIRRKTEALLTEGERERLGLIVGTVDSWQGGEADVVFFSLVVGTAAAPTAIGFLSRERRRFNVAISRARAVAVIVGDLTWALSSRIAHVVDLAERASRPSGQPKRGFDSLWERRVYEALRRRGLDPKEQFPVGRRSLDIALFEGDVKLDLEVDGVRFHTGVGGGRKTGDRLRDRELIAKGWKVRRFWVWELQQNMEGCLDLVERDLGRG